MGQTKSWHRNFGSSSSKHGLTLRLQIFYTRLFWSLFQGVKNYECSQSLSLTLSLIEVLRRTHNQEVTLHIHDNLGHSGHVSATG